MTSRSLKKPRHLILASLSILTATIIFSGHQANAAGGVSVAPAYLTATISDKSPIQDVAVGVRNDAEKSVQLHVTLGGIDQQRGILVPTNQVDNGLRSSLTISPTEFVIEPHQSINVKIHIENLPALSPGGHYATMIISQVSDSSQKISLNSAISVSLFLTKQGGARAKLSATKVVSPHSLFSLPSYVDIDFHSGGNVLVVPRAAVTVSSGGSLYSKGVANEQSVPVLPGKTVQLRATMDGLKRAFLPGRYKLNILYRYEGTDNTQTYQKTFWYLPFYWPLGILLIVAASYYFKLPSKLKKLRFPSKFIKNLKKSKLIHNIISKK